MVVTGTQVSAVTGHPVTTVTSGRSTRRSGPRAPAGGEPGPHADSVEFRELQGIGAWRAGTAVQGVFHHQDLGLVLRLEQLEDEGVDLHVVLASPAAAEPATSDRRPLAVPTVHEGPLEPQCSSVRSTWTLGFSWPLRNDPATSLSKPCRSR